MQVGRYRFVDRLAVGGMAEVYVAVAQGAQGFEKPVVIKRLLPQLAGHPRFQQMFLDEARTMLNLQHGNIVQILDMGRMDGLPFLALEYVDGKDLRTVLERVQLTGGALPHGLIAYIGSEVCRALDYAHRKTDEQGRPLHIVHRDVNPANIFLSHEGEVKVGDFGLAKARDNLDRSDAGIIKGKVSYLSPEQAHGQTLDHRSDIFSLGTTLYEMCCGSRPFDGPSDVEVVMQIRECRFPPPSELMPGFNPDLEATILRAMQADPADRFPTASQMREALSRYVQHLPTAPGDRELTQFLDGLFSAQRRSNSFLIKLAPLSTLPPPMTSVSRAGGVSEFQRVAGRDSPVVAITPASAPPRPRPRRGGRTAVVAAALVVGVALVGGALLYGALSREATASLSVTSKPAEALVLLDGRETGQRTPALLQGLGVGRDHWVELRHSDAAEVRRRFHFHRGGRYAYQFVLPRLKEALTVESEPPAADLLVDGELRGQTPLTLRLEQGKKYTVELHKTGYGPKAIQHYAEQRQSRLRITLEPEPRPTRRRLRGSVRAAPPGTKFTDPGHLSTGILEVATKARARVFIDGHFVGRTPDFRMMLPAGSYEVVVTPEGTKIRHEATIRIEPRRTHRFSLTPPER